MNHLSIKITIFSDEIKCDVSSMMAINKYSPKPISAQWNKDGKDGVSHETHLQMPIRNKAYYVVVKRLIW